MSVPRSSGVASPYIQDQSTGSEKEGRKVGPALHLHHAHKLNGRALVEAEVELAQHDGVLVGPPVVHGLRPLAASVALEDFVGSLCLVLHVPHGVFGFGAHLHHLFRPGDVELCETGRRGLHLARHVLGTDWGLGSRGPPSVARVDLADIMTETVALVTAGSALFDVTHGRRYAGNLAVAGTAGCGLSAGTVGGVPEALLGERRRADGEDQSEGEECRCRCHSGLSGLGSVVRYFTEE